MTTPNNAIPEVPEGTLDPAAGLNLALVVIDALLQTAPIRMDLTAPPGGSDDGDLYIVAGLGGTATGAWATQERKLARYVATGAFWQFYVARLVLDRDTGNLYKLDETSSPPSWVLAAGLGDAPNDGQAYFRRALTWESFIEGVTVEDLNSPPQQAVEVSTLILDTGLEFTESTGGVVVMRAAGGGVLDHSGANLDADQTNAGLYIRFSHATALFTFDGAETYKIGHEYHARNVGSGTLTLSPIAGFTLNAPADGSLVVPPDGTVTVKIVAADEADVMGVTV